MTKGRVMAHHTHLFWWLLIGVGLLAVVVAVRSLAKRRERSRGERAATDAGLGRADHTTPAPPRPDSER
jgi:hypothetical protein